MLQITTTFTPYLHISGGDFRLPNRSASADSG